MSIRLCMGGYAKNGYEPEHMGFKIYSLEELCLFMKENAYLLDDGFRDETLGTWLAEECELPELGEELRKACQKRISLKSFVEIILDYACFFPEEQRKAIGNIIVENSHLSLYEKRKARADALVKKGQFGLAGREYGSLLKMLPQNQNILRGEIYQGCGICLANMFYFELAGEYFLKAHSMTGKIACYQQYLWTKRLSVSEKEYMEFLKEHEEAYEDSVNMEETLEELKQQWEDSHGGMLLKAIHQEKEEGGIAAYQKKLDNRVEYLEDFYREMIE